MEISYRAAQDFAIWKQLCSADVKVVAAPRMSRKQKFFWKELMRLYQIDKPIQHTGEVLGKRYEFDKTLPLVFYSGGLESSVIAAMFPLFQKINYLEENLAPWTNPIEPALMICGAGLGYQTIFYGSELKEGLNRTIRDERDFHVYLGMLWREYSGCNFVSPISFFTKHDLFKIALRDKIGFYSCFSDNSPVWCGKCYKCLLIDLMYRIEGVESPIEMKVSAEDILSGKVGRINEGEIHVYKTLAEKYGKL